jgi:hypothetical protein
MTAAALTESPNSIQPTLDDLLDESNWLEYRALALPTSTITDLVSTDQTRAEFVTGARLLRLDQPSRARYDGRVGPTPIQLVIADMLNAGKFLNAILEPRRTTKTTSIEAVILGRCSMRDDYQVGWTLATLGAKASERFRKDIVVHVERVYPDPKQRPFKINVGKGTEHLQWPNGSFLNVYAPSGDGFRSGGFDLGWVDEGGEAEPELSEDLTIAVLPTMDTKTAAQFVVSGTAAKYRAGNLLWDTLMDESAGVIKHAIPETTDPEHLEAWEAEADHPRAMVRALVEQYHPGIGWTTPIESVKRNFEKFPRDKFLAEYLGVFGSEGSNVGLIPPPWWERTALAGALPEPPPLFTLALAIHPDGIWSSLAVAWNHNIEPDDLVSEALRLAGDVSPVDEKIAVGLLWHQQGVQGIANKALQYARKYKVPIIYDQLSQAAGVEVETLSRAMPRPGLQPATTSDVRRGATKVLKLVEDDTLRHWRQPALDNAVAIAIKRPIGAAGGFGFGRPKNEYAADITGIEAVSLAIQFLGDTSSPAKIEITFG